MEKNSNKNLDSIGGNLPFDVPKDYFENFALEMDAKINVKPVSFKRLLSPWMYLTAMFVGLFLITNIFYNIHLQNKTIDSEMYDYYVLSQIDQTILLDYYNIEHIEPLVAED